MRWMRKAVSCGQSSRMVTVCLLAIMALVVEAEEFKIVQNIALAKFMSFPE